MPPAGVAAGGCLCGRVRFRVRGALGLAEHCHCSRCRKWHGAAFSSNAELRTADFELERGGEELVEFRSSPLRARVFCRSCGGKLWIRRLDTPEAMALCLPTLDSDPGIRPERHVFHADAAPWWTCSDALPRFAVYPGFEVRLRPTRDADLDWVLALECDPANTPYIGSWSRAEHAAAIAATDREHWTIERASDGEPIGYLIAFDLRARGHGAFVKRIVVADKSRGLGREALGRFARHAFEELGAPHVWLTVFPENERAQRSYRALGFAVRDLEPARRAELHAASGGFSEKSFVMVLERDRS